MFSVTDPVRLETRTIGVNLAIFTVFRWTVSIDAAPTGLRFVKQRFSTEIPSQRDSRGFWSLQGFRVGSGSVMKPNLPGRGRRRLFFLKLTLMGRLECTSHLGEYTAKHAPTGPGVPKLDEKTEN